MRVALVSQEDLPDWEVDDLPLVSAFEALGAEVVRPAWSAEFDWSSVDAALLRTPWDYVDHIHAFLRWAEATSGATTLLHDADIVRWNLDKRYLRDLEARGVPLAPTVWLEPGDAVDVAAVMEAHGWQRAFLKPVVGASASYTLRFGRDEADAASAFAAERLTHGGMMLQPYLAGVESEGELSVVVIDGEPTHGVRKVPVPGDYRVQDDYGASDFPHSVEPDLAALASEALAAAAMVLGRSEPLLYARVDALRLPDGRLVLNELEIVEPSLFFRHGPHAATRLAEATLRRVSR